MKMREVSSKNEIDSLRKSDTIIHLAFRPSNKDIFALIQKYPDVKAIHVPSYYFKMISNSTKTVLNLQGISLLEGDIWGHRKDTNEYYEIKQEVLDTIEELKKEDLSEAEILKRMGRIPGLGKDLLQFLIKEKMEK
jgi:hypothetical protein